MRTLHRVDDQDVSQQERDEAVKHVSNELSQEIMFKPNQVLC
jgi:hypothetical protein